MNPEEYEDFDPEYRSRIFLARKRLLGDVESPSLLPASGLAARHLLNDKQLEVMQGIRKKRLHRVLDQFQAD